MRRYALVGVLVAALSCARQATAWDYTCWDCVAFRASLWLPFSKGDVQSRQWAVAAKMAADQFNARNGSIVAEFAKLPPACTFKFSVDVSHFSAMTRPTWLGRAARNRHDSRTGEQLGLGAAAPDEARLRRVCAPLGIHAKQWQARDGVCRLGRARGPRRPPEGRGRVPESHARPTAGRGILAAAA